MPHIHFSCKHSQSTIIGAAALMLVQPLQPATGSYTRRLPQADVCNMQQVAYLFNLHMPMGASLCADMTWLTVPVTPTLMGDTSLAAHAAH